jgi:hypothetical protein
MTELKIPYPDASGRDASTRTAEDWPRHRARARGRRSRRAGKARKAATTDE